MNENELLKYFIKAEDSSYLYRHKIWEKSIYSILRIYTRREFLRHNGVMTMSLKKMKNEKYLLSNVIISFFQLLNLFFGRKKFKNCIFSFPRIELVGNQYVDKFSDPVIALTNLKTNSIVFEFSIGGKHLKPRIHSNIVVYIDFIVFVAFVSAKLASWILPLFYKSTFDSYYSDLERIFTYPTTFKKQDYERIISFNIRVNIYKFFYRRLGVKKVFGVSRTNFIPQIYAAKECGIPVFELQHGITYGETPIYSGRKIENFTPNFFLSFGEIKNKEVYGIDPNHIINIGWAFKPFIKSLKIEKEFSKLDILVITDPEITDKICKVLSELAKIYHSYNFHLRLHPMKSISRENLEIIEQHKNILLQDNKINSNVALTMFTNVIGENSTVLYEAVSMGKKVARLALGGLHPKFINPEDYDSFFIIRKFEDFSKFIESNMDSRIPTSIYSEFTGDQLEVFK